MKLKITAHRNFLANGVPGTPGMVLSDEETKQILNLLEEMKAEGLIRVEEITPPATEDAAPSLSQEEKPKKRRK